MSYYFSYKGKLLGQPMTKEEAAAKMIRMRQLFAGLELVKAGDEEAASEAPPAKPKRTGRPPGSAAKV